MKGPKGWDYINEYKRTADGQYIYTGNLYTLSDARNSKIRLGIYWAIAVAAVIGSGLVNAAGMTNTYYVIIPYIAEVICVFALSWQTVRLLWTKGDFKEYYYNKIRNIIPAASFFMSVFAAVGLIGSVVFLVKNGFENKIFQSVMLLILQCVCIVTGILVYRCFKTFEFSKREQHND